MEHFLLTTFVLCLFIFISSEQKRCVNLVLCPADSRVKNQWRRKNFQFLTSSFMTVVFLFEFIIWHAAQITSTRERAHTPALSRKLGGRRHVLLSHAARIQRCHTGDVSGLEALLKEKEHTYQLTSTPMF